MTLAGIVRRIDDLGRIVIPKEIRRTLRIRETDPMEIFTDLDGQIILKKYSPIGELSSFATQYAESMSKATGTTVCITDREQIIAASGQDKKELVGKPVTKELSRIMDARRGVVATGKDNEYVGVTEENNFAQEALFPIICAGDVLGSVIMLTNEIQPRFSENERKLVQTAAYFLGNHMEA